MTIIAIATGTQKPIEAFMNENERLRAELGMVLNDKFSADQSLDEMMGRYLDDMQRLKDAEKRVAELEQANAELSAQLAATTELKAEVESSLDFAETFLDKLRAYVVKAIIEESQSSNPGSKPPSIAITPNFTTDLTVAQFMAENAMNKVRDVHRANAHPINIIAARIRLK